MMCAPRDSLSRRNVHLRAFFSISQGTRGCTGECLSWTRDVHVRPICQGMRESCSYRDGREMRTSGGEGDHGGGGELEGHERLSQGQHTLCVFMKETMLPSRFV